MLSSFYHLKSRGLGYVIRRGTLSSELLILPHSLLSSAPSPSPQVAEGASLLLSVLRDPALQRPSKAWYLLRVQALQLVAVYLSLSSGSLSASLWEQLCAQGERRGWMALLVWFVRCQLFSALVPSAVQLRG